MRIVSNNKLINRNKKLGNYTTIGSLVVLGLGLYISFTATTTDSFTWSLLCLIMGFLLSQIGIFFGNRWGRSPRPDEVLSSALKGLDDKYVLYHYMVSVPHLLVGPAGVWVIMPFNQQGTITFDDAKQRWKQKGGNWYMKFFFQEALGRPEQEAQTLTTDLKKFLKKEADVPGMPVPQAAIVFINPKSSVDAPNAYLPTMAIDKLKDFMRRMGREQPAALDTIRLLQQTLPEQNLD
jgi:hypothetical protein